MINALTPPGKVRIQITGLESGNEDPKWAGDCDSENDLRGSFTKEKPKLQTRLMVQQRCQPEGAE